jgi:hypothetical protein
MPKRMSSLLAGRNRAPLTQEEVRRAINVFLGLDNKVNAKYEADTKSAFRISVDDHTGEEFGEVVFGPDIYPGSGVIDPNSALSLDAAAAHELTHYHRWRDKTAIDAAELEHVDEALTSLQAIFRYEHQLSQTDLRLLVSDAIQRLQLYVKELPSPEDAASEAELEGGEREN